MGLWSGQTLYLPPEQIQLAFPSMAMAKQLGLASLLARGDSYTTIAAQEADGRVLIPYRLNLVSENDIPDTVGRWPHLLAPISRLFRGDAHLQAMTASASIKRPTTYTIYEDGSSW